jgi:hypothetical protein
MKTIVFFCKDDRNCEIEIGGVNEKTGGMSREERGDTGVA